MGQRAAGWELGAILCWPSCKISYLLAYANPERLSSTASLANWADRRASLCPGSQIQQLCAALPFAALLYFSHCLKIGSARLFLFPAPPSAPHGLARAAHGRPRPHPRPTHGASPGGCPAGWPPNKKPLVDPAQSPTKTALQRTPGQMVLPSVGSELACGCGSSPSRPLGPLTISTDIRRPGRKHVTGDPKRPQNGCPTDTRADG